MFNKNACVDWQVSSVLRFGSWQLTASPVTTSVKMILKVKQILECFESWWKNETVRKNGEWSGCQRKGKCLSWVDDVSWASSCTKSSSCLKLHIKRRARHAACVHVCFCCICLLFYIIKKRGISLYFVSNVEFALLQVCDWFENTIILFLFSLNVTRIFKTKIQI